VEVVRDQQLARFGVEDLRCFIAAASGELRAVQIPGDAKNPVAMARNGELLAAARHVEDADDAVGRGGSQPIALRIERTVEHNVACGSEDFDELTGVRLEQPQFTMFAWRATGNR